MESFLFDSYRMFFQSVIRLFPILTMLVITADFIIKKHNFSASYQFLRYSLLFYWLITVVSRIVYFGEVQSFIDRTTGPYWWSYLFTFYFSLLLPPFLLQAKIGRNKWLLLLIGFLSTFGAVAEAFVILLTTFHQDYMTDQFTSYYIALLFTPTFICFFFLIGIDLIFFKNKSKELNAEIDEEEGIIDN